MATSPEFSLLTSLLLLLASARLLGQLFRRWNKPSLLGELCAGVLLGPSVLGLVHPSPELDGVAELGVFFLTFLAGLEMDAGRVFKGLSGKGLRARVPWAIFMGFLIPFAGGALLGRAFHQDDKRVLILGLCMSITALPVVTHLLGRPGESDGLFKRVAIASAVFSDLAAMAAFGILFHLSGGEGPADLALAVADTAGGILLLGAGVAVAAGLGWTLLHLQNLGSHVRLDQGLDRLEGALGPGSTLSAALFFVLVFSSFSERLGFHGIVGTFLAALLLQPAHMGERHFKAVEDTLRALTDGFLGPVFFASLGLHFSGSAFSDPLLLGALLAVGLLSKVAAGFVAGALAGMGLAKRLALATLLNGRGMIELVVAEVALKRGFIGEQIFSDLVLLGALTTLCTCAAFPALWGRVRVGRRGPGGEASPAPSPEEPGAYLRDGIVMGDGS